MRRRRPQEEETPWASFSDALSGMLFVFVITTFWFALKLADETNQARKRTESASREVKRLTEAGEAARDLIERDGALGHLTACLAGSEYLRAEPERASARVSLYMRGDDPTASVKWFEPCQATLGERQALATSDMRRCVEEVLALEESRYDVRIFLEGHTDAVAVNNCGASLVSNWELSGARSAAVTRAVLGLGEEGVPSSSVGLALEEHRLQLLAVGLADTRPAWGALCARTSAFTPLDRRVCEALRSGKPDHISAALSDPDLEDCSVPPGSESCAGATDAARLCRWANWCTDADGSVDERRGLLRRVDMRVELDPSENLDLSEAPE